MKGSRGQGKKLEGDCELGKSCFSKFELEDIYPGERISGVKTGSGAGPQEPRVLLLKTGSEPVAVGIVNLDSKSDLTLFYLPCSETNQDIFSCLPPPCVCMCDGQIIVNHKISEIHGCMPGGWRWERAALLEEFNSDKQWIFFISTYKHIHFIFGATCNKLFFVVSVRFKLY